MKVVVAIDGSPSAEAAIDTLEKINWPGGTQIKILMVVSSDSAFGFGGKKSDDTNKAFKDVEHSAEDALKLVAERVQKDLPKCAVTHELQKGEAKSQIVENAKQWQANLIIMGSRGRKELESLFLGSVSQSVVMTSQCPVMVAKASSGVDDTKPFSRVLLAVDNSPYSAAAMKWLTSIDWGKGTQIKVITVVQPLIASFDTMASAAHAPNLVAKQEVVVETAKNEIEKMSHELHGFFPKENVSVQVGEGDPRSVILDIASGWSADLIVMGSHGRTGMEKFLLGSVSQAVAMHSETTVAIVRGLAAKNQTKMHQTGLFSAVPEKQ